MSLEFSITSNVGDVLAKIDSTTKDRMDKATKAVREEAVKLLSRPGQGREYYVPDTKRKYRASTPGNPPAKRTGTLMNHIKCSVQGEGDSLEGLVGSGEKYAPALEYGSRHPRSVGLNRYGGEKVTMGSTSIAPRPWLRPAFEHSTEKIREIFTAAWF